MTADLGVVIPTIGRPELCRTAIESVDRVRRDTSLEIELVVVEQGDEPAYPVPERFDGVWLFTEGSGACFARNVGFDHVTAPAVIFLDDDAELQPGVVELLEEVVHGRTPMACGRMVSPGGAVIRGADRRSRIRSWNAFDLFVEPAAVWDTGALRDVDGFDERYSPSSPLGAEEGAALLARIDGAVGRPMVFLPVDVAVHPILDDTPAAKARRYGAGCGATVWLQPGMWSAAYVAISVTRRVGGLVLSAVRRERVGLVHRWSWLRGVGSGLVAGRHLRAAPRRPTAPPVVRRA